MIDPTVGIDHSLPVGVRNRGRHVHKPRASGGRIFSRKRLERNLESVLAWYKLGEGERILARLGGPHTSAKERRDSEKRRDRREELQRIVVEKTRVQEAVRSSWDSLKDVRRERERYIKPADFQYCLLEWDDAHRKVVAGQRVGFKEQALAQLDLSPLMWRLNTQLLLNAPESVMSRKECHHMCRYLYAHVEDLARKDLPYGSALVSAWWSYVDASEKKVLKQRK